MARICAAAGTACHRVPPRHEIWVLLLQAQSSKGLKTEGAEGLLQPKALLPYRKRLPADRVAKLPNTTADTLRFVLGFNASGGRPLPPGHSLQLGEFEISGAHVSRARAFGTDGTARAVAVLECERWRCMLMWCTAMRHPA